MAGAVRQLTCDARVVMMRVDSDAKRGVASFDRPRSQVGKCANSIHSPSGGVPGEGEVRAELTQLFEVSLSTTRIDPLLEGLRLFARFCGSSFYARRRLQWYNRGPLTPNGSQMTVAGHFHLLHLCLTRRLDTTTR